MKKRLLCGILSLGLVLSQLPAAALAAEAPVQGQNQEAMEEEAADEGKEADTPEDVSAEGASSEEEPSENLTADDAADAESGHNTDGGAAIDQDTAANADDSQDAIDNDAGEADDSQDAVGNDTDETEDGQNTAGDEADVPADSVLTDTTDSEENGTANEEIEEPDDAASPDFPRRGSGDRSTGRSGQSHKRYLRGACVMDAGRRDPHSHRQRRYGKLWEFV